MYSNDFSWLIKMAIKPIHIYGKNSLKILIGGPGRLIMFHLTTSHYLRLLYQQIYNEKNMWSSYNWVAPVYSLHCTENNKIQLKIKHNTYSINQSDHSQNGRNSCWVSAILTAIGLIRSISRKYASRYLCHAKPLIRLSSNGAKHVKDQCTRAKSANVKVDSHFEYKYKGHFLAIKPTILSQYLSFTHRVKYTRILRYCSLYICHTKRVVFPFWDNEISTSFL